MAGMVGSAELAQRREWRGATGLLGRYVRPAGVLPRVRRWCIGRGPPRGGDSFSPSAEVSPEDQSKSPPPSLPPPLRLDPDIPGIRAIYVSRSRPRALGGRHPRVLSFSPVPRPRARPRGRARQVAGIVAGRVGSSVAMSSSTPPAKPWQRASASDSTMTKPWESGAGPPDETPGVARPSRPWESNGTGNAAPGENATSSGAATAIGGARAGTGYATAGFSGGYGSPYSSYGGYGACPPLESPRTVAAGGLVRPARRPRVRRRPSSVVVAPGAGGRGPAPIVRGFARRGVLGELYGADGGVRRNVRGHGHHAAVRHGGLRGLR